MSAPPTDRARAGATTARTRTRGAGTSRRRPRAARWEGLDAARGLTVLAAVVLYTAAASAPGALAPTPWLGLRTIDVVPGVFLVVAGAGLGWRIDTGATWLAPRGRRRALLLIGFGLGIAVARAGGDPAALAADELLRLAAALGLARLVLLLSRPWVVLVATLFALVPHALVAIDPLGRGLRATEPSAGWAFESAVGLTTGGAPVVSLLPAVSLVLVGVALGTWVHRRPPGPATSAALATVGAWSLVATVVVGQVIAPVPVTLNLPVVFAAVGGAALVLAAGHLVGTSSSSPSLATVGRTALPIVVTGTVVLPRLPPGLLPELPSLAAVTAGGVAAAGAVVAARRLDATRWTWRA